MIFWMNFVLLYIHDFEMFYFASRFLPTRYSGFRSAFLCASVMQILAWIRMRYAAPDNMVREIIMVLSLVFLIGYCMVVLQGRLWKKLEVMLILVAVENAIDLFCAFLIFGWDGMGNMKYDSSQRMAAALLFGLMYTAAGLLLIRLWNRESSRFRMYDLLSAAFMLVQIGFIYVRADVFVEAYEVDLLEVLVMFLILVADIIIVLVLAELERTGRARQALREMEILQEQERVYYQTMLWEQRELAKLRHDYRNQLQTVTRLLEEGYENSGQELLYSVREQMKVQKTGDRE